MNFFRHHWFRLFAVLAFLVIAGDLIADAVHDEKGLCATESQSGDHGSCPSCACSLHLGTVLMSPPPSICPPVEIATLLSEPAAPDMACLAAEIEHPPQLA
jgi:hypothetical protein